MLSSKLFFTFANILAVASAGVLPRQASGGISCNQGSPNTIQVTDIQGLITNLNNNNIAGLSEGSFDLRSLLTLGKSNSNTVTEGSIKIEVTNNQPFESTHVAFTTVAQALQQYQDVCCGSFPSCIGGKTAVAGDTGLVVDLKIETV
jgi:hypothetical protein